MFCKTPEKVIKSFEDYSIMVSEAKFKATHGKDLKILTPKQLLQRLPKTLAEVKSGNTSKSLQIKVRQILIFWYRAKKLLKKYVTI